ncbi:hypothetical protein [Microvirga arabica]|uniref:hypothetical protein n=1 Tax=Microvirga arabica TaxID=1128671 RepID=UPI001FEC7479|nr:hypothetical protein [Microvirga arabica]
MKKKFVTALVLSAGAAFVGQAAAAPAKPASYDGTWSVRLVTEAGSCDASYHYTIAVEDGRVRPISAAGASVSGGVGRDGSVTLSVQRSIAQAQASGRLRASSGSGTWRLAMLGCTGRWTAERGTVQAQAS